MEKSQSLAELIEPFINWQFKDMPPELCQYVSYAFYKMPHWDELEPHERLSLALKYDSQQALLHASKPEFDKAWELDNQIEDVQAEIDRCKSIVPVSHADDVLGHTRISELEAKKAELEKAWDSETLEAAHWFAKPVVTASDAALLLWHHNPNKITFDFDFAALCDKPVQREIVKLNQRLDILKTVKPDKTVQSEIVQLKQRLDELNTIKPDEIVQRDIVQLNDALNKAAPSERTLRDWLEYARSKNIKYHPWIDRYAAPLPPPTNEVLPVLQPPRQTDTVGDSVGAKPWLIDDPQDPKPEQAWYTPARYFARQLVIKDSTLLTKRLMLANKVSMSLAAVHIFKRGGKKPLLADTVLKAFVNVSLG